MLPHVGKRGGPSTPSPTWRVEVSSPNDNNQGYPIQEFLNPTTTVSARKLCSILWEIQPQPHLSLSKMSKNIRARGSLRGCHSHRDKKAFQPHSRVVDPPNSPPDQMASYKPAIIPSSSLNVKSRRGQPSYSLKTSTELLKVLNQIWTLEEQQSSNVCLLKALRMELDRSQSQVKLLLKEREAHRHGMDDFMKQISQDKAVRKTKEQDQIKAAIQSACEELEDERKVRKHSERMHQKIACELSEVKSSFSNALKDLERERKARILLENLCDEFAKGIRDYEQEVRSLKHKPDMDHVGREKPDWLILHISEAWLDERMQMKIAELQNDLEEKNTIVDKLSVDIETFLQARHSVGLRRDENLLVNEVVNNCSRRESFPLNEVVSAPQIAVDEDSTDSDSCCFELNKRASIRQSIGRCDNNAAESHLEEIVKKVVGLSENSKVCNLPIPNPKMQCGGEGDERGEKQVTGITDVYETTKGLHERKCKQVRSHGFNSSIVPKHLIRKHSLSSEGDKIHLKAEDSYVQPVFRGQASPVKQWKSKLTSPEFEKYESLKLPSCIKENTLKEKLLEARLEDQGQGHGKRSRAKPSNPPFWVDG